MCEDNRRPKERRNFERCQEYCDGNIAVYYCPQCWTNFCDDCYEKEHKLKRRKEDHEKIHTPRKVCPRHNLTLEYQNKVKNSFLCCMCVREMPSGEFSTDSVEPIDDIASTLRSKLHERISELELLSQHIGKTMDLCNLNISTAIEEARNEVKRFFSAIRLLLAKQEESFQHQLTALHHASQSKPVLSEMQQTMLLTNQLTEQGKGLLTEDSLVVAMDFNHIVTQMDELLANTKIKNFASPTLRVSVNVHRHLLEMVAQPGYISSTFDDPCKANTNPLCSLQGNESVENSSLRPLDVSSVDDQNLNGVEQNICNCVEDGVDPLLDVKDTTMRERNGFETPDNKSDISTDERKSSKRKSSQLMSNYLPFNRKTRRGEISKELSRCDDILTELWASDDSFPFARPVDQKKVPSYYDVIKRPMDLTIIKSKLASISYESVYDFVDDMKLVFDNCFQFNTPDCETYENGVNLERQFVSLLRESFPLVCYESSAPNENIFRTKTKATR